MRLTALFVFVVFLFSSCKKDEDLSSTSTADPASLAIEDLKVDPNFEFRTEEQVTLSISDVATQRVKYTVYAAFDGQNEEKISSFMAVAGNQQVVLSIPTFCKRLKVERNADGQIEVNYVSITNGNAVLSFTKRNGKAMNCSETLYAVNGQGGFYTIDMEGGSYTATAQPNLIGGGSIACAVNQASNIMYYNTGTTLRYYDYSAGTFHVAQNSNPFNGVYPRMEYNPADGLLYIAKNEKMYTLDPITNTIIQEFNIVGLASPVGGGDVAISLDSTIYMCCFSGLYRIDINGNTANATRISGENLPFKPTSMAIDRNDRLYLATNSSNSQLIEMDKFDGAWSIVKTYTHTINDLGSYKCDVNQLSNVDSDNDGVIDAQDDYPNDPDAAQATYTPSDIGWGSLAFEDLWPSQGDYDFNDLVVSYRFTQVANAANGVVRLEAKFKVKAIGASFRNGFGFKMNVDPSLISSVTGSNISENYITLDGKGLEAGHSNGSTIIVFDDAFDNIPNTGSLYVNTERGQPIVEGTELLITITFSNPVDASLLGSAPFNPFIIVNGDRGREVHLADQAPTDLVNSALFGSIHDDSNVASGRTYRTENNLPWGINIIHEFRYPEEKKPINTAYNFFNTWALGSGATYEDWYKDNSGYRNTNNIIIN